jgi:hypothetical protein
VLRNSWGSTWIKLNNQVHVFVVDSQGHCQMIEFRDFQCSCRDCECSWTILGNKYVLHHVEEEEKVFHLCQHSKKLAFAHSSWCLFLHRLLVMPVVFLVNRYIKFIFCLACLVITLFELDTIIRCGTTERTAMEPPFSFDFLPLLFVPLRSGASFLVCMELFLKPSPTFPVFLLHKKLFLSPACNKSLIWNCQFTVALDYQTIPEKNLCGFPMTFCEVSAFVLHPPLWAVGILWYTFGTRW